MKRPAARFAGLGFALALGVSLSAQPAAPGAPGTVDRAVLGRLMTDISNHYLRNTPLKRGEYRRGSWAEVEQSVLPKACYWSYPTGVALLGLQRVFDLTGDRRLLDFVAENNAISAEHYAFLRWQQAQFGRVFKTSGFEKLRRQVRFTPQEEELIEIIGDYVTKKQARLPDGSFWSPESPDGPTMWVDDMFMGVPFLVRWAEYKRDPAALDDAARQIINYAARLQDRDGVFFHAYFVNEQRPNGFKWGRGNGWVAVAMAELLSALPGDHPRRAAVLDIYRRQMAGLRSRQDPSGLWHQVIDHPELSWGTRPRAAASSSTRWRAA
jgi:rhamnogalacturonyl hydrolase YesR